MRTYITELYSIYIYLYIYIYIYCRYGVVMFHILVENRKHELVQKRYIGDEREEDKMYTISMVHCS